MRSELNEKPIISHLYFVDDADADPSDDAENNAQDDADKKSDGNAKDEKKYTDKDYDAFKVKAKKEAEARAEAKYAAKAKADSEAAKLEKMNAEEKAKYERDQLRKELDELKRANSRAEMSRTVRSVLSEAGVNVPDALSDVLVRDDADATKDATDAFIKAYKAAVQRGVKDALNNKKPTRAGSGGSVKSATRDDYLKEKDPRKRQKMLRDNPGLLD